MCHMWHIVASHIYTYECINFSVICLCMYLYVWYVAALVAKAQASSQPSCTDRKHAGLNITLVKRTLPLWTARRRRSAHRMAQLGRGIPLYCFYDCWKGTQASSSSAASPAWRTLNRTSTARMIHKCRGHRPGLELSIGICHL